MSDIDNVFEKPQTRIRELVIKSGKKLIEISEITGIGYSTLGNYNQGTRVPNAKNAQILSDFFGVSVPYLLGLDDLSNLKEQAYHYFQEKISALESEVSRLSSYEYDYRLLRDVVADCLLQGQLTVSELPQAICLIQDDDLFYTYAWRFVEAKGDCQAAIILLKTLQDDVTYLFLIGKLSHKQYSQWLEKWLSFLERGRIAFKGDEDFERYFQEQKEKHRELFEAFGI